MEQKNSQWFSHFQKLLISKETERIKEQSFLCFRLRCYDLMEEWQLLGLADKGHLINIVNLLWLNILEIHISQLSWDAQVLQVNLHNFRQYLGTSSFLCQLHKSGDFFFVHFGSKCLPFFVVFFFWVLAFHLRINFHFKRLCKMKLHQ